MSVSNVQLAAQPSPPCTTQCRHPPPGQAESLLHTAPFFAPPTHTPVPWHCASAVQWVPAFAPPRQVPPSSQSSPASMNPLPHCADPLDVGVAVTVIVGVSPCPGVIVSTGVCPGVGVGVGV